MNHFGPKFNKCGSTYEIHPFFNVFISRDSTPSFTSPSCPHRSSPDPPLVFTGSPDYPFSFQPSLTFLREVSTLSNCHTEMLLAAACTLSGGFLPALCILIPARCCFSGMLPSAQASPLEMPHSFALPGDLFDFYVKEIVSHLNCINQEKK